MKIKDILILKEAVEDLDNGRIFYDQIHEGVGSYFWNSAVADIESLIIYAGVHQKSYGLYRMLAKPFPYAIYYEIRDETAFVIAVLPMVRDPVWIKNKLGYRK